MPLLLLFGAILAETVATLSLTASNGFVRLGPSLLSIAGYAVAFFLLSLCLRSIPVGIAYAIWSGVGIVLVGVLGRVLFKQTLDAPALAGIGLILLGVLVIQLFSRGGGAH